MFGFVKAKYIYFMGLFNRVSVTALYISHEALGIGTIINAWKWVPDPFQSVNTDARSEQGLSL